MSVLSAFVGCKRLSALAPVAMVSLALSACGGGGGGGGQDDNPPDPNGGSGGTPPSALIDALAGDWVQKGCVKTGAQSFKKFLRANVTGQTALDYHEGVLSFNSNDCTGASQLVGPSKLGVVTFARSEKNQSLAAYWGEFRTVTNTRFGAIWTLQSSNLLCLLGDDIPSSQPSLSAVSTSLATIPADNCFARRNP